MAKSEPDGYTIMLAGIPMYLLPLLSQGTVTFDPLQDLVHVARVARVPFGLVVSADSPYQTLDDLLNRVHDVIASHYYLRRPESTPGKEKAA